MMSVGDKPSEIQWLRDWDQANLLARNTRRLLLIDVEKDN